MGPDVRPPGRRMILEGIDALGGATTNALRSFKTKGVTSFKTI